MFLSVGWHEGGEDHGLTEIVGIKKVRGEAVTPALPLTFFGIHLKEKPTFTGRIHMTLRRFGAR